MPCLGCRSAVAVIVNSAFWSSGEHADRRLYRYPKPCQVAVSRPHKAQFWLSLSASCAPIAARHGVVTTCWLVGYGFTTADLTGSCSDGLHETSSAIVESSTETARPRQSAMREATRRPVGGMTARLRGSIIEMAPARCPGCRAWSSSSRVGTHMRLA
jgi:hypothetical protein